MAPTRIRHDRRLDRAGLLDDYLARAKGNYGALAATALRTRSLGMRDILLHGALRTGIRSEELKGQLLEGKILRADDITDLRALAELGRVVLLQNLLPEDVYYGELLLSTACRYDLNGKLPAQCRRVLVQHYIVQKKNEQANYLLDTWPDVDRQAFNYLRAELSNPFRDEALGRSDDWFDSFNRPFTHHGLAPVTLSSDHARLPFDRLIPTERLPSTDGQGPRVSVVLTAFKPDEERLLTSVHSILEQTWRNLELIIVDDCSGPNYEVTFDRLKSIDSRILVVHAPENQGTYAARNIGYSLSSGELITGQDDDDWSHPERIERQVAYLQNNEMAIGCRVNAVRCDNNLQRVRVGYSPMGQNASSLMIRREAFEKAGNFLPARKAADTEYHMRVERITGRPVPTLAEPLSVIRILPSSLSRGDFDPAWKHRSRISFRSAYEYWHRESEIDDLYVDDDGPVNVKIPNRFQISPIVTGFQLDVVIAANWEDSGEHLEILMEEVRALLAADLRVGIINLESPLKIRHKIQVSLDDNIQSLINNGDVEEVFLDDEFDIKLLILRHVPALQFLESKTSSLNVGCLIIGADIPPTTGAGRHIVYLPQECTANATSTFGVEPLWVPWSIAVRNALEKYSKSANLANLDLPKVINVSEKAPTKRWYRSSIPIVGYYTFGKGSGWPVTDGDAGPVRRVMGHYDVRCWGDTHSSLHESVRGVDHLLYSSKEITLRNFLKSLDYFIFFPDSDIPDLRFNLVVLQAIAAGVLVVLPHKYKPVYGDAAIYARPQEIGEVIAELHSNFDIYSSYLSRALQTLRSDFDYPAYAKFIAGFLSK